MASWTETRLKDPGYQRFVLACLTLDWACIQLEPYLKHVVEGLHRDLLANGHTTPVCHSSLDSYRAVKACPHVSCGSSVRFLDGYHTSGSVYKGWKNSQIELWSTHPWSIGLLYMNPGQDPTVNTSPAKTDISGILNLMLYCTKFGANRTLVEEIRTTRNTLIHHTPHLQVTTATFNKLMDNLKKLFVDPFVVGHVSASAAGYIENVKKMKLDITFEDEIKLFKEMRQSSSKKLNHIQTFIDKHEDILTELKITSAHNTKEINHIKAFMMCLFICCLSYMVFAMCNPTTVSDERSELISNFKTVSENDVHQLKKELVDCYSRPEFTRLSPLVDDDTFKHFIEDVYVEVSLTEKIIQPIMGKSGLDDSIRQPGRQVKKVNQMIPPPGGQRLLLSGFVGSGKTSLCLYYLRQWTSCQRRNCDINNALNKYEFIIFLRARALESSIYQSVANMLNGEDGNAQMEIAKIKAILNSKFSSLIILDGYDEATQQQKEMVDQLVSYKILAKTSVIITSRPNFFYGQIDKWYDNLGFNYEQQLRFIAQFKRTLPKDQVENYDKFEQLFMHDKYFSKQFTSPMMAMITCTMVAAGEKVGLGSRIKNYQQLSEFLARRACFKYQGKITLDKITSALPGFTKAAYFQMLKHQAFQFSREELLVYVSPDTLDNIIVHLGYMSVTKYILSSNTDIAYTFIHKSWAEFAAARYVMSLPIAERSTAVGQLFKSGPANLEVLRFVLGLCGKDEPKHVATLFRSAAEVVIQLAIPDEKYQHEIENIDGFDMVYGSSYLMLHLTDIEAHTLPASALWELTRMCVAIRVARIKDDTINAAIQGQIDVSNSDRNSASALYTGLLLTAHRNHQSLDSVRGLQVRCSPSSPHSAVTHFPTTLANCAPHMTALSQVTVGGLVSVTELGAVCRGLTANGAQRLTNLVLVGDGDSNLNNIAGGDLGALVHLIRTATQLLELQLWDIHCGEELQFEELCAAVEQALQLRFLRLVHCNVSAQQYRAVLLPAMRRRNSAGGARLQEVALMYERSRKGEDWYWLGVGLQMIADKVYFPD